MTRDSTHDSSGGIGHSITCRSVNHNDVKRKGHGICQESSDKLINSQVMLETGSAGSLSEVMEEIIDLDAGLVTQYDSSG